DHFGVNDKLQGTRTQQIFHGASDNATGVAMLLELAKAYKALPAPPKRTIVFIATTGEEQGLLGAQYYVHHPLYPLHRTLANINIDGINTWGPTKDVEIIGFGHSSMDDRVKKFAAMQGRTVRPETRPELGSFYRADHFEFAKAGVPVVYVKGGTDYIGKPESYARDRVDEHIAQRYQKVTAAVFFMGIPGGWIADRLLGQRNAVLYGGILIAMGHYSLAIDSRPSFYAGLVLIVLGTGLLKPNISAIVGQLYSADDNRRDAGF